MPTKRKTTKKVDVAVIMGSDSDHPIMKDAGVALKQMGVSYEMKVVSAHRTPQEMFEFSKSASKKYKAIIAAAGGAAHLPGMVASLTELPVVGVPIANTPLQGKDSLHSIVQMPKGVPVATVAINGAFNAGLLAAQIISAGDPKVLKKVKTYKEALRQMVLKKKLKK